MNVKVFTIISVWNVWRYKKAGFVVAYLYAAWSSLQSVVVYVGRNSSLLSVLLGLVLTRDFFRWLIFGWLIQGINRERMWEIHGTKDTSKERKDR